MKLNQIQAFTEVMLVGSVTEAARNLNRTQPSVSALIASLEDELGLKLFERRNSRLHPVPEAAYLFEECSEVLRRLENISDNMRRVTGLARGELKVASMPGPSVFLIPDLIARHGLSQDDVRCTMVSRSSDAVYQLVGAQQYDVGIADFDQNTTAETSLINIETFDFQCVCALSVDDPLALKSIVTASDLDGRTLATLYPEHSNHGRIRQAFAACDSRMNVRFMTQNFIPLLTSVEKGIACAIVDPITAESYRLYKDDGGHIVFRPFEPSVRFTVAVITPAYRPASVLAKHFTEQVVKRFEGLAERAAPA